MKAKASLLLTAVLALTILTAYPALSDHAPVITAGEGWSWDNGSYNTFDGEIDLSGLEGTALAVEMSTDLEYDAENEPDSRPVYVIVNDKRIAMKKQSDTVLYQPEAGDTALRFSGRLRLPEAQHVHSITFTFNVKDSEGNIVKTVSSVLGGSGMNDAFYIPADIRTIALSIAAAAAAVWTAAAARIRYFRKKTGNGV